MNYFMGAPSAAEVTYKLRDCLGKKYNFRHQEGEEVLNKIMENEKRLGQ